LTIRLRLLEDRSYSIDDLTKLLASQTAISEKHAEKFIQTVLQRISSNIEPLVIEIARVYARRFRFNVKPISVQKNILEVGEWIGVYRIPADREEIALIVEPKIGEKAFEDMVNHITKYLPPGINVEALLHRYLHDSPDPFLNFHDILAYSSLFISLLEATLAEGLPLTIMKEERLSMDVYGSINIEKSINGSQIFEDKVFSIKTATVFSQAFLIIISLCNELLCRHLRNLINAPLPLEYVKEKVKNRLMLHSHIASSFIFSEYRAPAYLIDLDEYIRRAYVECGNKPYAKRLLDLTVQFLEKHKPFEAKLRPWTEITSTFILVPSALVYELWILSLMAKFLKERDQSIIVTEDPTIEIHSRNENLTITYQESPIIFLSPHHPRISYQPRPDFVLSDNAHEKIIVCDAKYRTLNSLRSEDYERIISYIATISKGEKELAGFLFLLNSKELNPGVNLLRERKTTNPPIRLYAIELDPRTPKQALKNLEEFFNHIKQH